MGYKGKICLFAKWLIPFLAAVFLLFGTDTDTVSEEAAGNSAFAEQTAAWL